MSGKVRLNTENTIIKTRTCLGVQKELNLPSSFGQNHLVDHFVEAGPELLVFQVTLDLLARRVLLLRKLAE